MDRDQLKQAFDEQAASYDQKWSRLAAFRDSLHVLIGSVFRGLPSNARVLCAGAGTGAETEFFRPIAQRLRPGGLLASSDLSADVRSDAYQGLLDVWLRAIAAGAFERPVQFFQAGLIHAWYARRAP